MTTSESTQSFRTSSIDILFPRYELRYPLRRLNLGQRETSRSSFPYVSSIKGSKDRWKKHRLAGCLSLEASDVSRWFSRLKNNERADEISNAKEGIQGMRVEIEIVSIRVLFARSIRFANVFVIIDIIWTSGTMLPLLSSLSKRKRSVLKIGTGVCLN